MAVGKEYFVGPVVVVIQDVHAPASERARNLGKVGDHRIVIETAVTIVAEEREILVGKRRSQNIRPAVVIEVGEVRPHARKRVAVLGIGYPRRRPYFGKRSVPIVLEQELREGVVGNVDVRVAVVVVVSECHP